MSKTVNIHEAKTHLSHLLVRVSAGETIIIAKANRPIAKLSPIITKKKQIRKLGSAKGKIQIGSNFNDPLPEAVISLFEK